ncbi:hypothetical protein OPAG_08158 [Rhodococcus opacus PD630]|uniref:hypothetical protein n=1 Tax=Rhodococcus opacus TaxID=37919 RepID=UPI00029CCDE7|nr:hypothetical protein [Rhodococcus opacus]EHI41339.1 hypothetical protein OPAG_08158 [Rhodococcus opacus PD630]UDH01654.1 hypothetical protein K2Z90_008081 [Rhodococcus opacus PD630]
MELVHPDGEGPWRGLTPRQARVVAVVATTLADAVYADADALAGRRIAGDQGSVLASLPASSWAQDTGWRRQVARAFDDLAEDIAVGTDPEPSCIGEELALHLVLVAAADRYRKGDFDTVLGDLPEHPGDDDWAASAEILFGGHEVRALSGSDPVRGGPDLDPADWFLPFEPGKTRNPDRGFRL